MIFMAYPVPEHHLSGYDNFPSLLHSVNQAAATERAEDQGALMLTFRYLKRMKVAQGSASLKRSALVEALRGSTCGNRIWNSLVISMKLSGGSVGASG